MEELLDKLKLLNYENSFLKIKFSNYHIYKGLKPINKFFFCSMNQTQNQFTYFTSLSLWLLNQCEVPIVNDLTNQSKVSIVNFLIENSIRLNIIKDFRNLNFFLQGYGKEVIQILLDLSNKALALKGFQIKNMSYQEIPNITDNSIININPSKEFDFEDFSESTEENFLTDLITYRAVDPNEKYKSMLDSDFLENERKIFDLKSFLRVASLLTPCLNVLSERINFQLSILNTKEKQISNLIYNKHINTFIINSNQISYFTEKIDDKNKNLNILKCKFNDLNNQIKVKQVFF